MGLSLGKSVEATGKRAGRNAKTNNVKGDVADAGLDSGGGLKSIVGGKGSTSKTAKKTVKTTTATVK